VVARAAFQVLDQQVDFAAAVADGAVVKAGQIVAEIRGSARAILTGERTALNFLGRMSGIATRTRQFVEETSRDERQNSRYPQDSPEPARLLTSWPCGSAAAKTTGSACMT
jgi:nicotinate-nucleotide pyrophosphorylase